MNLTSRARLAAPFGPLAARNVLGWPKRCKSAHAFLWEYSYNRLKLAQLLDQLGVFLTCVATCRPYFQYVSS